MHLVDCASPKASRFYLSDAKLSDQFMVEGVGITALKRKAA
jgi:hypothetical protein